MTMPYPTLEWIHTVGAKVGVFSQHADEGHEDLIDRATMKKLIVGTNLRLTTYKRFLGGANQLFVRPPSTRRSLGNIAAVQDPAVPEEGDSDRSISARLVRLAEHRQLHGVVAKVVTGLVVVGVIVGSVRDRQAPQALQPGSALFSWPWSVSVILLVPQQRHRILVDQVAGVGTDIGPAHRHPGVDQGDRGCNAFLIGVALVKFERSCTGRGRGRSVRSYSSPVQRSWSSACRLRSPACPRCRGERRGRARASCSSSSRRARPLDSLFSSSTKWWPLVGLDPAVVTLIEMGSVLLAGFRMILIIAGLGYHVSLTQAFAISLAGHLGRDGNHARRPRRAEGLAGIFGRLTGQVAGVSLVGSVIDRVVSYIAPCLLAGVVLGVSRRGKKTEGATRRRRCRRGGRGRHISRSRSQPGGGGARSQCCSGM